MELLLIYGNGGPPVLNIAQHCAFLCFAIIVSITDAKDKEKERKKRKRSTIRKKRERNKSNFNQPCTDFIDCVVVKSFEKVIQYAGPCLFFFFRCFLEEYVGHLDHTGTNK
jgi:hypothetical protein